MNIIFAPEAEADLRATLEFIADRNPGAALKLGKQVFSALQKLSSGRVDGASHRLITGESVHSWLIPPFRVYYQRQQNTLNVLRIYHSARRPITK